jgi:hypothetical protein
MAKDEHSAETVHSERPGAKTLDYIALGLLLAPPAEVFAVYIRGEPIDWRRTAIATTVCWLVGGLIVMASKGWQSWRPSWRILPFLIAAENKWWGKAFVIAVCMVGVLLLNSFLANEPPNNEAQKSTLIEWLQEAQGARDNARLERDRTYNTYCTDLSTCCRVYRLTSTGSMGLDH